MAGGMHTHEPVSPLPVDGKPDSLSYLWQGLVGRRDMDDLVLGFARHGCLDDDPVAARTFDHADIARLAAGRRIEDRTVQNDAAAIRSEEHTSELQSRENLVCRLLLEKKKNRNEE